MQKSIRVVMQMIVTAISPEVIVTLLSSTCTYLELSNTHSTTTSTARATRTRARVIRAGVGRIVSMVILLSFLAICV